MQASVDIAMREMHVLASAHSLPPGQTFERIAAQAVPGAQPEAQWDAFARLPALMVGLATIAPRRLEER